MFRSVSVDSRMAKKSPSSLGVEAMTNPVEGLGYRTVTLYREGETIPPLIPGAHPIPVNDVLP